MARMTASFMNYNSVWDNLATLLPNWDSYGAEPPSPQAIQMAKTICQLAIALGKGPKRIAASVIGGVGMTWYEGETKIYTECCNDGSVAVMVAPPDIDKIEVVSSAD